MSVLSLCCHACTVCPNACSLVGVTGLRDQLRLLDPRSDSATMHNSDRLHCTTSRDGAGRSVSTADPSSATRLGGRSVSIGRESALRQAVAPESGVALRSL